MKKITKGAIAAGAAAILLVGGGGTFMSWNQDDAIVVSKISAGTLTLDTTADAVWTLNGVNVSAGIDDVRIVPGDVLQFSQAATITAEGDNIEGTLEIPQGTITAVDPENEADEQLANALNRTEGTSIVIESNSLGLTEVEGLEGVYEFEGADEYNANLVATFDFGFGSVADAVAQGGKATISDLQLSLVQTDATPSDEVS